MNKWEVIALFLTAVGFALFCVIGTIFYFIDKVGEEMTELKGIDKKKIKNEHFRDCKEKNDL